MPFLRLANGASTFRSLRSHLETILRDSSRSRDRRQASKNPMKPAKATASVPGDKGMSASQHVNPLPKKLLTAFVTCLLAAASFAQNAAPQTAPPANPPLTPLPQAPAPQRSGHPYSDQDYSRGKRQWPNPFTVYGLREVAPLNVANSGRTDHLLIDGKLVSVAQRCRRHGAGR